MQVHIQLYVAHKLIRLHEEKMIGTKYVKNTIGYLSFFVLVSLDSDLGSLPLLTSQKIRQGLKCRVSSGRLDQ